MNNKKNSDLPQACQRIARYNLTFDLMYLTCRVVNERAIKERNAKKGAIICGVSLSIPRSHRPLGFFSSAIHLATPHGQTRLPAEHWRSLSYCTSSLRLPIIKSTPPSLRSSKYIEPPRNRAIFARSKKICFLCFHVFWFFFFYYLFRKSRNSHMLPGVPEEPAAIPPSPPITTTSNISSRFAERAL